MEVLRRAVEQVRLARVVALAHLAGSRAISPLVRLREDHLILKGFAAPAANCRVGRAVEGEVEHGLRQRLIAGRRGGQTGENEGNQTVHAAPVQISWVGRRMFCRARNACGKLETPPELHSRGKRGMEAGENLTGRAPWSAAIDTLARTLATPHYMLQPNPESSRIARCRGGTCPPVGGPDSSAIRAASAARGFGQTSCGFATPIAS